MTMLRMLLFSTCAAGAFLFSTGISAQILHSENFAVILDTSKHFKGNVLPSFSYQNLREELIKFENTADFSVQFKRHAVTISNKFELSRFGDETFESGGYVYLEYRSLSQNQKFGIEPYAQMHWNEARGLNLRYAGGFYFRWQVYTTSDKGFFAGIGPLYEYEMWDYRGVGDAELIPENTESITVDRFRFAAYLSYKHELGNKFLLDFSSYYQGIGERPFVNARLASSSRVTYKLTRFLGLTLLYQNIFDPQPIVPIDELYHNITFSLSINL